MQNLLISLSGDHPLHDRFDTTRKDKLREHVVTTRILASAWRHKRTDIEVNDFAFDQNYGCFVEEAPGNNFMVSLTKEAECKAKLYYGAINLDDNKKVLLYDTLIEWKGLKFRIVSDRIRCLFPTLTKEDKERGFVIYSLIECVNRHFNITDKKEKIKNGSDRSVWIDISVTRSLNVLICHTMIDLVNASLEIIDYRIFYIRVQQNSHVYPKLTEMQSVKCASVSKSSLRLVYKCSENQKKIVISAGNIELFIIPEILLVLRDLIDLGHVFLPKTFFDITKANNDENMEISVDLRSLKAYFIDHPTFLEIMNMTLRALSMRDIFEIIVSGSNTRLVYEGDQCLHIHMESFGVKNMKNVSMKSLRILWNPYSGLDRLKTYLLAFTVIESYNDLLGLLSSSTKRENRYAEFLISNDLSLQILGCLIELNVGIISETRKATSCSERRQKMNHECSMGMSCDDTRSDKIEQDGLMNKIALIRSSIIHSRNFYTNIQRVQLNRELWVIQSSEILSNLLNGSREVFVDNLVTNFQYNRDNMIFLKDKIDMPAYPILHTSIKMSSSLVQKQSGEELSFHIRIDKLFVSLSREEYLNLYRLVILISNTIFDAKQILKDFWIYNPFKLKLAQKMEESPQIFRDSTESSPLSSKTIMSFV